MEDTIILYLLALRLQGAPQTKLVMYRSRLGRLNRFFRRPVRKLGQDDFPKYLAYLREFLSEDSIVGHLGCAHAFLGWCVAEGFLTENPFLAPEDAGTGQYLIALAPDWMRQPRPAGHFPSR